MVKLRAIYRAYSSTANLGSGFDVIAAALDAFYDEALININLDGNGRVNTTLLGPYASEVRGVNLVEEVARRIISEFNLKVDIDIRLWKGIPVGKGLGSSGASIALTIRALNELLDLGLSIEDEVLLAGMGESLVAGTPHYDNVAASLLGGIVVVLEEANGRITPVKLDVGYSDLRFIIAIPNVRIHDMKTGFMRSILPKEVPLSLVIKNSSRIAALIAGLIEGNYYLIGKGLEDYIITPIRSRYVPCYDEVRVCALRSGAFGVALSGAGPSVIIVAPNNKVRNVMASIEKAYRMCGVEAEVKYSRVASGVTCIKRW